MEQQRENPTLTDEEKEHVLEVVVNYVDGRVPVIAELGLTILKNQSKHQ